MNSMPSSGGNWHAHTTRPLPKINISGDESFPSVAPGSIFRTLKNRSVNYAEPSSDLGMKAVKFSGGWADGDLDNEVLWPLYEEIAAGLIFRSWSIREREFLKRSIVIPGSWAQKRYQGFPHFPTALGFPLTYMVSAARLIFSGVLDRFPTLKFAFFEGGIGWVPWLMHTLNAHTPSEAGISTAVKQFFDGKQKSKEHPSEYFNQFYIAARLLGNLLARNDQGLAESQHHHRQRL